MDCPEIRLHLPIDMLAKALRPLRDGGAWADLEAWRQLLGPGDTAANPRSWCLANANRLAHGLDGDDLRLLLGALRLVLDGAYARYNYPEAHADPALCDKVRAEAAAVTKATNDALIWLQFEADAILQPDLADDQRVYALARALLPFVDAPSWERQLRPDEDPEDRNAGTWVCRAGIHAKLHAEAALARYARHLEADPYDDPIPGTAPEIWNTPPEAHLRCSTLVDTGPRRPRLRVVEATDGVEVAPAAAQGPELELGGDAVPSRPYLQVAAPPSCTPDGPDLDFKARAYLQGEQARRAGLGHGDNPHDDDLREAWAAGYDLQTVGRVPARARELQIATDALLDDLAAGGEPLHRAEELPGGTDLWGNLQPVDPEELAACMDSELDPEAARGEAYTWDNVPTCTCRGCGGPLYGDLGSCGRCHPRT